MALPEQIRKQTEAVQELYKQLNGDENNGKTYSPDDIKLFFNDVRSGKYRGREAERDRIERDIFAAQRDGRITVNA